MWIRLARYLLVAVAAFLLLCGLSALAVPLLIDKVVLPQVGEYLGRQVTAERLRFNPFTLVLNARGIRVADQDSKVDFVTVDSVEADLSVSSVRYLAPVIDRLTISRPVVELRRLPGDRFNFSDIAERLKAAESNASDPDAEPARFALRNFEVSAGEIRIDDQVLQQQHRIADLQIGVPFVSTLDQASAVTVLPALSALVNGSPLSLAGVSVPFSDTRETTLDVVLQDLDIATYLRLSPVALGFTVPKGKLGTSLKIHFKRESGAGQLTISGSAGIDALQVDALGGPRLLSAKRVAVSLEQVEPLANRYGLGELAISGLDIDLERKADGRFPLVLALTPGNGEKGKAAAASAPAKLEPVPPPPARPLHWSIRQTELEAGRVRFIDRTVSPAVQLNHSDIRIALAEIGNRQEKAAAGKLSFRQNETSHLSWAGELDLPRGRAGGRLEAGVASIADYLPYLAGILDAGLETGALAVKGGLELGWAEAFTLEVADATASVEKAQLRLPGDSGPAVALARLAAEGVSVSLARRTADVARVELAGAKVEVVRDAEGGLNLERLGGGAAVPQAERPAPAAQARPWAVKVARLDLENNDVSWRDLGAPQEVNLTIRQLGGGIEGLGTDLSSPSKVDLKARIGDAGELAARGVLTLSPWTLDLDLQLQRLSLAGFDPYLAQRLALGIDEGELSTTGQLGLGGDRVRYRGQVAIDGLRSRERTSSVETIRWKKLLLDGIDVDIDPATLGPSDRIIVGGVTLSEFFARVLLDAQGRFNLQDIVHSEASDQARARAEARKSAGADLGSTTGPGDTDEGAPPPVANRSSAPQSMAGPQAAGRDGPQIQLGAVRLEGGSSNFTDRFVKPNYSVNLTGLQGEFAPMASNNPAPSKFTLAGRVDGNAPVDITGSIAPFGETLYADIRAQAKGIDLPTLTPYSAKYAGYAIEKGKLSVDVHYKIENEQLQAQNRIILDQLTFGEKIASPNATSLPLQFLLGLLKNRDGAIDLSLPISGSLDDPQFSIGSVLGNAIANLLTRVVTSPFSALASAFGGSEEELSFVTFRPGSATLTGESLKRLETMAKALTERPALKLEIAGRVDPVAEKDAIKRQRLDARLKALKRRRAGAVDSPASPAPADSPGRTGAAASGSIQPQERQAQQPQQPQAQQPQGGQAQARQEEAAINSGVTVSRDEYPDLLKQLFEETEFPDMPRNAVAPSPGLQVAEMEQLLLDAIPVDADAARRIATRRSQVVQRWLASEGKVAEERMFMLAPRTNPGTTGPNQSKPQCTASCAEFSLR